MAQVVCLPCERVIHLWDGLKDIGHRRKMDNLYNSVNLACYAYTMKQRVLIHGVICVSRHGVPLSIKQDKLTWPYHTSDLKGWNAAGGKLYRVNSIPTSYLIDGDGIIIGKNLRGAALEAALEKQLK